MGDISTIWKSIIRQKNSLFTKLTFNLSIYDPKYNASMIFKLKARVSLPSVTISAYNRSYAYGFESCFFKMKK